MGGRDCRLVPGNTCEVQPLEPQRTRLSGPLQIEQRESGATPDAGTTAGGDATTGAGETASASSPADTWSDVTDPAPQDTVIPQDTVTEGPTDPR